MRSIRGSGSRTGHGERDGRAGEQSGELSGRYVTKVIEAPSFFVRVYGVPRHIGLFWQLDVPGSVIRREHGSVMYDSTRKAFPQILVIAWFDTS
jgi:hypothetical protein